MLDYNAQMAAIAARNRAGSGYGHGGGYPSGGGGGGSFAPSTNWQGSNPAALTTPWNLPYSLNPASNGTTAGSSFTPGTYTDQMNPLYGYTQEPGLPNTVPGSEWQPPSWDNLLPGNDSYSPPGGINTAGMSEDELDWLYNVGG